MTKSQAYKFAELFDLLSDPEALMIIEALEESTDEEMDINELAKLASTSTNEVKTQMNKFENKGIVNRGEKDGVESYKFQSSSAGRFVRAVLERALESYT